MLQESSFTRAIILKLVNQPFFGSPSQDEPCIYRSPGRPSINSATGTGVEVSWRPTEAKDVVAL